MRSGCTSLASSRAVVAVEAGGHLEPVEAQARLQQFDDVLLVIDDEQPCLGCLRPASWPSLCRRTHQESCGNPVSIPVNRTGASSQAPTCCSQGPHRFAGHGGSHEDDASSGSTWASPSSSWRPASAPTSGCSPPRTAVPPPAAPSACRPGTVSETVTATGTVETAGTVELSFANGGTVDTGQGGPGRHGPGRQGPRAASTTPPRDSPSTRRGAPTSRPSPERQTSPASLASRQRSRPSTTRRATAKLNKQGYEQAVTQARTDARRCEVLVVGLAASTRPAPARTPTPGRSCALPRPTSPARRPPTTRPSRPPSADETTNNLKVNQAAVDIAEAQSKQYSDCSTYGGSVAASARPRSTRVDQRAAAVRAPPSTATQTSPRSSASRAS